MKFYICKTCGKIIAIVKETAVPTMCCGQKMKELIPGTSDGALEKHVPVFKVEGNKVTVTVGSVEHAKLDEHFIEWVAIETTKGAQRKLLKPGEKPCVEFMLTDDDSLVALYEYCNLHGLWKAE